MDAARGVTDRTSEGAVEAEAKGRPRPGRHRRPRGAPRPTATLPPQPRRPLHAADPEPRVGGRQLATAALTAAFLSGLLSQAAHAAPPADPHTTTRDDAQTPSATSELPDVFPRPQTLRAQGDFVRVAERAVLVVDPDADPYALDAVRATLRSAGARSLVEVGPGDPLPAQGTVIRLGTDAVGGALDALHAPAAGDLPAGGYRLAIGEAGGRDTVALDGLGDDGLFHAAQTLRQLLTDGEDGKGFPGAVVRDWAAASVRGTAEAFYGTPWTHQQRLDHLDFLGRTKQNRFLYAPGDDSYRQAAQWRDAYPQAERARFRALAERAKRNHVELTWAVSPGQNICFSSEDDRKALLKKLDAMHALGFGAFQLRFEDVSYSEWHCDEDADTYGEGPRAAARAQAELANEVAAHLRERHPHTSPLSVLPTEYYQKGRTEYRSELADRLDQNVQVAWTGVGVVPRTITGGELDGTRAALGGHPLLTTDNYPINDWSRDRVFLGPYTGRDAAVATRSAGLLSNAMAQPTASRIPLFTAADFAWNPRAYRPSESWRAAIDDAAGGPDAPAKTRAAVRALARNDASSVLGTAESGHLTSALAAFHRAYRAGEQDALRKAAKRLRTEFAAMRTASQHVPDQLAGEVGPWLQQLERYGTAGEQAVAMLTAQAAGDGEAAWKAQLALRPLRTAAQHASATVGKGVLQNFLDDSLRLSEEWTGGAGKPRTTQELTAHGTPAARAGSPLSAAVDGDPTTAYRAAGAPTTRYFTAGTPPMLVPPSHPKRGAQAREALTVSLPKARPLSAVTVQTQPRSGTRARVEAHVKGEGWRELGALADSGWTQLDGVKDDADAVRLVWSRGSAAPVVHEVTPWYADAPDASLTLPRGEIDAAAGGGTTRVSAKLTGHRPGDVTGRVQAKTPKGITVHAPKSSTVRRGSTVEVPLEISVDASVGTGTHRIPLTFGDEHRTLTLHTFPRSGGSDLAAGAPARSSADETDDFPASALTDGHGTTRWSSPATDDAWVQVKLRKPSRLARAVLHWQDAHAKRYRVQVSPDGKRWRTAAAVRHSDGGREQVRMDTPKDTRYVRIQGDKRATQYGYSLWSLKLYAATED